MYETVATLISLANHSLFVISAYVMYNYRYVHSKLLTKVFCVSLQSVSRGSPNMPHHYFMPRPGPPFVPNPPPLGAVSANYMPMHGPPPGHMSYFPPPPQPR